MKILFGIDYVVFSKVYLAYASSKLCEFIYSLSDTTGLFHSFHMTVFPRPFAFILDFDDDDVLWFCLIMAIMFMQIIKWMMTIKMMILELMSMIILESYFVKRDGNIRTVLELCSKLPDWHLKLIGKTVSETFSVKKNVDLMVPPVWPPHGLKYALGGLRQCHKLGWVWSERVFSCRLTTSDSWMIETCICDCIWHLMDSAPEGGCAWELGWAFGKVFASAGRTTGGCKRRIFRNWWMECLTFMSLFT